MKGMPLTLLIVSLAGNLLWPATARADPPAENRYWAKVDAIVCVARIFPAAEAATFEAFMTKALTEGGRPKEGLDPSFKRMEEYGLLDALKNLITPHVQQGELDIVKGFLRAVSDAKWVQGYLLARNGGDYVTILDLVVGDDGTYVFRVFNKAARPGDWKGTIFNHPLGIRVERGGVEKPKD